MAPFSAGDAFVKIMGIETETETVVRQPTFGLARGFTLLEVLVVVGIIAMLSSIAWPQWQRHVASSQQAVLVLSLIHI